MGQKKAQDERGCYRRSRTHPASARPLSAFLDRIAGRGGVDDERMNTARKLACERRIDHAVPFEPALPAKGLRHDIHSEMDLAAGSMHGLRAGGTRLRRTGSRAQKPCATFP